MSHETEAEDFLFGSFTLPLIVTQRVVENILITAFDSSCGGCNYFLECYPTTVGKRRGQDIFESFAQYKQKLRITLDKELDDMVHTLTYTNFLNGLRLAIQNGLELKVITDDYPVDANQADCIIQYAIFGELTYC